MSTDPATAARWDAIKSRFDELLELDPTERSRRLEDLAREDCGLAREVAALLKHAATGDFLDAPADLQAVLEPACRDEVGSWRLLRLLGHGGMGVVFEAERADGAYAQRVAIKLVDGGWARPMLRERLAAERRFLAGLDHPGIARLIDGGETRNGNPYLVMEFVDGTPITTYASASRLALPARLQLVIAALDAVQFAHERLIVHRDLKPSNVLVTTGGQVKLLDFGIAKAIATGPGAAADATRIFTPAYASPEQMRGEPATAAADVYSMGVLLYELIAGSHPFQPQSEGADAWMEAALSTRAEAPSRRLQRVDPRAPRVPSELDVIVLKAMARNVADRYRTARELAEDLRAYLDHRPISVRTPSPLYVAAKLFRRKPLATGLATAAIVAVLGTSVVALRLADQADRARLDSERRFNEVRRLANDIVFGYQDALEPLGGQALDVRLRLVRDGLGYLDALTSSPNMSDELLREAAAAYQRIGDLLGNLTQANLGHSGESLASYRKALALREALFAKYPSGAQEAMALGGVQHAIGRAYLTQGDIARARATFAQAEALMTSHVGNDDQLALLQLRLDSAAAQSCASFGYQGDSRAALAQVRELQPQFSSLLARRRGAAELEANLSYLLASGALHGCTGGLAQAVDSFAAAEALTRELRDLQPYNVTFLQRRAMILLEYGYWRAVSGEVAAGIGRIEESRDLLESLYESNKRDAKLRLDLATVYSKLGGLQLRVGRVDEAGTGARRAEAVLQTLVAEAPENKAFHTLLGSAYNRQAQVASARGRHADALRLTNLAIRELRASGDDTAHKSYLAIVLGYRASIEAALGDGEAAAGSLVQSAAIARVAAAENPAAVDTRVTLARSLVSLAEQAPAATLARHGLDAAGVRREALDLLTELERGGRLPPAEKALLTRATATRPLPPASSPETLPANPSRT
jgi:tetratricopeptide (TPR) repeat protein/tRNA A-37 threonylcarbamoyl transferase component Bud32